MYDQAGFFSFEEPLNVHSHSMDTFERPRDTDQYLNPQQRYALSRTQSHQQQVLPSFRDIIPAHLHNAIETAPPSAQSDLHSPTSTSTNLPAQSDISRSDATSPLQSHPNAIAIFGENMEDYSVRAQDPQYPSHQSVRRQTDHIPTWTQPSSQYPEISSVYSAQQTTSMYPSQPYSSYRGGPALPSIHDSQSRVDKYSNGIDPSRSMGMSSYPPLPGYGQPSAHRIELQNGTYDSRRGSYYDQPQRHPQNHPPVVRHNGHNLDYQSQYQPRFDPYRGQNPYAGSYTDMDYQTQTVPVPQSSNFSMAGESVDSRGKRRRGNLPKPVTDILRAWFHEHLDHPYPTEEDKQQFMQRTGLTLNQISNWFINARRRQLPALRHNRDRASQIQHGRDRGDRYRSQESSIEPR